MSERTKSLLEIAVLTAASLLAFSVVAIAGPAAKDIPEDVQKSVMGLVADCGAKHGWAMAEVGEDYSPGAAMRPCLRVLGQYQQWLINERKADIDEASRIAVATLVGGYYGAYRAVVVSRAKERKEGKYRL